MKFISLFAGIGGFDLALIRQGHKCVFANEWDKYAAQIYDKNFCSINRNENRGEQSNSQTDDETGERLESKTGKDISSEKGLFSQYSNDYQRGQKPIDTRDIRTVPTEEIPNHDLLVGGFPCQAFSIAGKRRGFDDTRGTLFFEIARILREKHTRLFILENVKGLLSHDNGNTFKTIIATLDELGYDIQWQVLNSKNFGVPQNRERVFIIGNLRGTSRPKVFPVTGSCGKTKSLVYAQKSDREISRIYDPKGLAPTLHLKTGGWQEPKIAHTVRTSGRGSYGKKQNWDSYEILGKVRRLTPIECERLQGFPDRFTEGVSDTQRYKMCGNAVTVNVVEYIVNRLSA